MQIPDSDWEVHIQILRRILQLETNHTEFVQILKQLGELEPFLPCNWQQNEERLKEQKKMSPLVEDKVAQVLQDYTSTIKEVEGRNNSQVRIIPTN